MSLLFFFPPFFISFSFFPFFQLNSWHDKELAIEDARTKEESYIYYTKICCCVWSWTTKSSLPPVDRDRCKSVYAHEDDDGSKWRCEKILDSVGMECSIGVQAFSSCSSFSLFRTQNSRVMSSIKEVVNFKFMIYPNSLWCNGVCWCHIWLFITVIWAGL